MNINLDNYKELPSSIVDRNLQREASREITQKLSEIKSHWYALRAIPEVAEQMADINNALDEDSINANIDEQIASLRVLPLPPQEKEKYVSEWKALKEKIDYHRSALRAAMDYFPDGYVTIEGESVSISLEDKEELEIKQATIATPDVCKALYERFMSVIKEVQAFEEWQAESGFKCRSFFDMVCYYPTAESIARAFLGGAWSK